MGILKRITANNTIANDTEGTPLCASTISQLYKETMEELRSCSELKPTGTIEDTENDLREGALLDLESYLLNRASRVALKTEKDVDTLMDLWARSISIGEQNSEASDKIAMNIFRHLSAANR